MHKCFIDGVSDENGYVCCCCCCLRCEVKTCPHKSLEIYTSQNPQREVEAVEVGQVTPSGLSVVSHLSMRLWARGQDLK